MNSFYGVLASSFYRFTDKAIGAAITSFAREAITSIIRTLEADGNQVVYSDTDSVFVLSPVASIEGARAFGEQRLQTVHRGRGPVRVPIRLRIALQPRSQEALRRAHRLAEGGARRPRYETRRTDAFDYQSESLLEVFDLVLRGDTQAAVERARGSSDD